MTAPRIATYNAHPDTVFEALLDAAENLGFRVQVIDVKSHQATIRREAKAYHLSASVTDNGLGSATLHVSWSPPGSSGAAKCGKRIVKDTTAYLASLEAPPPPPPG